MSSEKQAARKAKKAAMRNHEDGQQDNEFSGPRFSDTLRLRTIKIVTQGSEFYVHEELLCQESEKFKKQLRGDFKEAQTGEIPDCEEDPALMGMFFEYLYRGGWLLNEKISHTSQFVLLASLYCLADRLSAKSFKDAVFWKFTNAFYESEPLSDQEICELLLVIHTELPEQEGHAEDLRNIIFWCTASRLSTLRHYSDFKNHILRQHPELGSQILRWASPADSRSMPSINTNRPGPRFKEEVEFI
ncbi:uncharacterized protein J3D65DRAFT_672289 [Phyllosticta citribraziliensis]|uniref:BTB domain-containing protein n=1 Tax=Phyllosticta citribraziliensis TaxID=989973 RepID=A0ABR1L3T6_9PEZI